MNLDQGRFLFWVAAIGATTACEVSEGGGEGGGGSGTTGTTTTTSTDGGAGGEASIGGRSDGGAGGGNGGAGGSVGGAGGSVGGAGGAGGSGGGTCDDSIGTPDVCTSTCEGFDYCSTMEGDLKPAIAEAYVDCTNALYSETCTSVDVFACLHGALEAACYDATATDDCSGWATSCEITDDAAFQEGCHGYLDGLAEEVRAEVTTCAFEGGCSDAALAYCVESLTYF